MYLNGNFLTAACKYHPTQCLSTMEAEYMGEVFAIKEAAFIQTLISELSPHFSVCTPIPIFGDNNAALKFAEEAAVNSCIKHIDLRHHFITDYVEGGEISMNYVCTSENVADILTKPLSIPVFRKFRDLMYGQNREISK